MSLQNATIRKARLGLVMGSIISIDLSLDYGHACQSFGGWRLSHMKNGPDDLLAAWVIGLFKTFEVGDLQELVGLPCRVRSTHEKVSSIGHFTKDQWFDPEFIVQRRAEKVAEEIADEAP